MWPGRAAPEARRMGPHRSVPRLPCGHSRQLGTLELTCPLECWARMTELAIPFTVLSWCPLNWRGQAQAPGTHPGIVELINLQEVGGQAKQFLKIVEPHNLQLGDDE